MGRARRSFIDKKTSETYHLIYRDYDDEQQNDTDRVLVQQRQTPSSGPSRHRPHFPFFDTEADELTEEQEKEIVELGLPLDGYNYLQHLRSLRSKPKAELLIPDSSHKRGVFIPSDNFIVPEIETRLVNATGLVLHSLAADEEEAEDPMRSSATKAFSRVVQDIRGRVADEVEALDSLVQAYERPEMESGDLLDSFVLDATIVEDETTLLGESGTLASRKNKWIALPEDLDEEEDIVSHESQTKSIGRSRFSRGSMDSSGSFSERWKGTDPSDFEGRKPRTRPLEIIEEAFETILEEYDDKEMDDLEYDEEDGMTLEELTEYLKRGIGLKEDTLVSQEGHNNEKNRPPKKLGNYKLMKPKKKTAALKEKDRRALRATKRLALVQENASSGRKEWEDILVSVKSDKALDCESSWSLKTHSTLYQPSIIKVPQKTKVNPNTISTSQIELSSKSGLPLEHHQQQGDDVFVGKSETVHQHRRRDESLEDKKSRKQVIKQAQKEARVLKKQTKLLYRQAMIQQQKQNAAVITKNASVIQL